jgi:PAS domain S-box-containing protein
MKLFRQLITHFNSLISGLAFGGSLWVLIYLLQNANEPWFTTSKFIMSVVAVASLALFVQSFLSRQEPTEEPQEAKPDYFTSDIFKSSIEPLICIFSLNGQFKDCNAGWQRYTGLKTENSSEMGWLQVIHPDDREAFLVQWHAFIDRRAGFYCKHRIKSADGSLKWVLSTATHYNDDIKLFCCDVSDLTEANLLLNQLKDGLDHATIIAITDEKGLITYANKAFCKISQYEEKELLGKTHRIINSGTHEKTYFKSMWSTITAGEIWVGEICNRAKDGTLYWTHAIVIPFLNEAKKPFQYLALRVEITKRKKQEIIYQSISELFHAFTGQIIPSNITKTMVEKAQLTTRSAIGFLGIKCDEKIYIYNICQAIRNNENKKFEFLSVKENFYEEDAETILGWILSQSKPFIIKENGRFPYPFGGNITTIKINSFVGIPFQFAGDGQAYLGLANSDIPYETSTIDDLEPLIQTFSRILADLKTQDIKRELTNQIQKREESLSAFISNLPASMVMLDTKYNIINHSDKWAHDYHLETTNIHQKNLFEISPELPAKWKEYLDRSFNNVELVTCEEAIISKTGITDWIKWEIHPWIKDNTIAGLVIQSYITTLEKDMQIEIEQLRYRQMLTSRMAVLGEMAGGIAHEINNPLAIISGYSERLKRLLNRGQLTEENVNKVVTNIEQTVDRITFIIKGLKAFARDGDNDPYLPNFVNKIVKDTLPFAEAKLAKNQIFLKQEPISDNIIIECRPVQISQVILNLINNACDAIQNLEDRWVEVKVEDLETEVNIKITDSGSGIPKHIAEKIMQPFFTTKEAGKGTGLGLSISKSIIEGHAGVFYLDEKCPNTRFILRLPKTQHRPLSVSNGEEALATINAWKQRLINLLQKEQATAVETKVCPLCRWLKNLEAKYTGIAPYQDLVRSHEIFHSECQVVSSEIENFRDLTLQKIFQVSSTFNKSYKDLWNHIILLNICVTNNEKKDDGDSKAA